MSEDWWSSTYVKLCLMANFLHCAFFFLMWHCKNPVLQETKFVTSSKELGLAKTRLLIKYWGKTLLYVFKICSVKSHCVICSVINSYGGAFQHQGEKLH